MRSHQYFAYLIDRSTFLRVQVEEQKLSMFKPSCTALYLCSYLKNDFYNKNNNNNSSNSSAADNNGRSQCCTHAGLLRYFQSVQAWFDSLDHGEKVLHALTYSSGSYQVQTCTEYYAWSTGLIEICGQHIRTQTSIVFLQNIFIDYQHKFNYTEVIEY